MGKKKASAKKTTKKKVVKKAAAPKPTGPHFNYDPIKEPKGPHPISHEGSRGPQPLKDKGPQPL